MGRKVVVLTGGISTERDVSLSSGKMIYEAVKRNGHQAVLLDVYLGYKENTEGIFEKEEDWAKEIGAVGLENPDIEAVKALREDGEKNFFGPNVRRRMWYLWLFMGRTEKMEKSRPVSI